MKLLPIHCEKKNLNKMKNSGVMVKVFAIEPLGHRLQCSSPEQPKDVIAT